MDNHLGPLKIDRKSGAERLREGRTDLGVSLIDFWQWSVSDLVSNATRGRFAEYLVARALGVSTDGVRDEWAAFDLLTPTGVRVEVKSAAFIQTWHQRRLSPITFVTPKTRLWDASANVRISEPKRQADVYVFALLHHTDKSTVDPLDVSQWTFYVLPTSTLDARTRSQHSITFRTLEKLCGDPRHSHASQPQLRRRPDMKRTRYARRDAMWHHLDASPQRPHQIGGDSGGRCGRAGATVHAGRHSDRVALVQGWR